MPFSQIQVQEFIKSVKERSYNSDDPAFIKEIKDLEEYLLGNTSNVPTLQALSYWYVSHIIDFLSPIGQWSVSDKIIMDLLTKKKTWQDLEWYFFSWVGKQIENEEGVDTLGLLAAELKKYGIKDGEILNSVIGELSYQFLNEKTEKPTSVGNYILNLLPFKAKEIIKIANNDGEDHYLLTFLIRFHKQTVDEYVGEFIRPESNYYKTIAIDDSNVGVLLEADAVRYEPAILKALEMVTDAGNYYVVMKKLAKAFPEKYKDRYIEVCYTYLNKHREEVNAAGNNYYYERWENDDDNTESSLPISALATKHLLWSDQENFKVFLTTFLKETKSIQPQVLKAIEESLKENSVDVLATAMSADSQITDATYLKTLLELLSKYDYSHHEDRVWAMAKNKSKRIREIVAVNLSKLGDKAIEKASQLLNGKSVDLRQTGALILSLIKTDETKRILEEALNAEKSDDARDVMLASLGEVLYQNITEKEVSKIVEEAKNRGKLDKSIEKWLDESSLPKLVYKSGKEVDLETIRFLFYRMSRAKEMRPDIEAKPVLQLIDREKSGEFALKVFKVYLANGADSKQKYCLALAGLLGDDEIVETLRATVNKWVESSRGKMAEYAVGALALIGSNKALRTVEFLSRKYKNKNRNVGEAAQKALVIAAEELGITMYELADSIIPDFGFDGLFKTFDVNGEEYRAFVDNNFKLAFFDEDNKKLKSPPKGTTDQLKEEFKEIGKEVRDIVRSQSDRLEQYLVIQRKWELGPWQKFFLNNPVMFVYAMRLVWAAYDKNGKIIFPFLVLEDTSLVNAEDEEASLEDDMFIGMVHPLSLPQEETEKWIAKLFDYGIQTEFPQLNRPVVKMDSKDRDKKMSSEFDKKKIDGLQTRGLLEKSGWARGSVVDSGMISSYRKIFSGNDIEAILEVSGIIVGYYEDYDPELGRFYFVKKGSVLVGNYTYDEPADSNDARLIPFGEIPEIIYSEVMSDLKKIEIKEEETKSK